MRDVKRSCYFVIRENGTTNCMSSVQFAQIDHNGDYVDVEDDEDVAPIVMEIRDPKFCRWVFSSELT